MSDQTENTKAEAAESSPQASTPPKTERPVEEMGHKIEGEIRDFIAKLVGAAPDDDWDTIGRMVDASFRNRIAQVFNAKPVEEQEEASWEDIRITVDVQLRETLGGWAGAERGDDWRTVGEKIDTKIRTLLHGAFGKTEKKPAEADAVDVSEDVSEEATEAETVEEAEPDSWEKVGGDIEHKVRKEVGRWAGAEPEAGWESIGALFADKFRNVFSGVKDAGRSASEAKTQVPISDEEEAESADEKSSDAAQ